MGRLLIRCNEQQHINLIQDTLQEIYSLNQNIILILWIRSKSEYLPEIEIETIQNSNNNNTILFLDISGFGSSKQSDLIWFVFNLLPLSSALLLEKGNDESFILQFQFLEQLLSLFNNEIGTLKAATTFPPLILYSSAPINSKDSKKLLENFLKPESGFSEDISHRNSIRGIIDSLFHSREILAPDTTITNYLELLTSSNFLKRFNFFQSLPFGCLITNGQFISKLFQSYINDRIGLSHVTQDIKDQVIEDYLLDIETNCYNFYSSNIQIILSKSQDNLVTNLPLMKNYKQESLSIHAKNIAIWNANSTESRKRLQSKIEIDIDIYCETIKKYITENCQKFLNNLNNNSSSTTTNITESTTSLTLGESANAYNEFLALKNSIEKIITSYTNTTQQQFLLLNNSSSNISTSANIVKEKLFNEEINTIRSEVLTKFLIQRISLSLEMGNNWLIAFNKLMNQTNDKKESLKAEMQSLQTKNIDLDRSIDQKKRVTTENYRLLTTELTELRSKQTLELEAKHSEIESLVEAIDRSTRLNEREKAEIADELMEIQQRIQVAQSKALELRQQREEQTNLLHNNLLESEREGHRWFRTAFANQHTLLAEELSLERKLNQRKSEQMAELFALEGEHLRHMDSIRTLGQKDLQKLREENFQKRDKLNKDHDATMTMLRMKNIELEGKLLTVSQTGQQRQENEACKMM